MPVRKGTRLDPAATRQRILDASAQLFYAMGGSQLSMNQVALNAGASKETLYRNFESKASLIAELIDVRSALTTGRFHDAVLAAGPDPRRQLDAYFGELGRMIDEDEFVGCPIVKTATSCDANDRTKAQAQAHFARHRDLLKNICERAGVSNSDQAAGQMYIIAAGTVSLAGATRQPHGLAGMACEAAQSLLNNAPSSVDDHGC